MEQQGDSWHDWRKKGLGASDAPIVMGVSPWRTPYQLWELKTGRVQPNAGNYATNRGHALEPIARAECELETGLDFPARLVEHPAFPFLRASLDGWNEETRTVLEIKCPGAPDHGTALAGSIPDKYYPQIQHQLFVTGAAEALYFSYHPEFEIKTASVRVRADVEYQKILFDKMLKFWACVKGDVPPELTAKDYKLVRDSEAKALFEAWSEAKRNANIAALAEEAARKAALGHEAVAGKGRVRCGAWRVNVIHRKGNIDYKKVPELAGVDLEQYRGKAASYCTITETEE